MLVVWLRDGRLYKAHACSSRTWRRVANNWNEYAQLWNRRFERDKNVIGVINDEDVAMIFKVHKGLPRHTPKDILRKQRNIRELMRVAPWGNWKN